MEEEYRICFENYEISNLGNCRKKLKNGYKKVAGNIFKNGKGYLGFKLKRDNKYITKLFHQQVAYQFLGERPVNMVIDHKDRNKLNNCVENLHYITQRENMKNQDKYRSDILITDIRERHNIIERESIKRRKERKLMINEDFNIL